MLSENIKILRRRKGLSQYELAEKLHVVRQTVSKWERGLSVPDSDIIIKLAEIFDTSVAKLLGENLEYDSQNESENILSLSEKLEAINFEFAKAKIRRSKLILLFLVVVLLIIVFCFAILIKYDNIYTNFDRLDTEYAVLATFLHALEWGFTRLAPFVAIFMCMSIIILTKKIYYQK